MAHCHIELIWVLYHIPEFTQFRLFLTIVFNFIFYDLFSLVALLKQVTENGTRKEIIQDASYDSDEQEPLLRGKTYSIQ